VPAAQIERTSEHDGGAAEAGGNVIVFDPGVLLAAMMASRSEDLLINSRQVGDRTVSTETAGVKGWIDNILIGGDHNSGSCDKETRLHPDRQRLSTQAVKLRTILCAFMTFFLLIGHGLNAISLLPLFGTHRSKACQVFMALTSLLLSFAITACFVSRDKDNPG